MMHILLKLTTLLFVATLNCFAMDTIVLEHGERHKKFTINRQDNKIFDHTQTIYNVLSDESRISKRLATDAKRKIIFQSIMATRIIDGGIEENRQIVIGDFAHTVVDQENKDHYETIKLVDKVSRTVVAQIKDAGYEGINVESLVSDFNHLRNFNDVEIDTFMDWFYESLEQHYDEFSFFGGAIVGASSASGKIDREWFKKIQTQFSDKKLTTQSCKNGKVEHTWILDTQEKPEAIYKPRLVNPKMNSNISGKHKERNVSCETLSGLFAKVVNIDDVVNRTIPVRVEGDQLIFDPCKPTGTIERLIGFSESHIPSDNDDFSNLMRHVCKFYKAKGEKEIQVPLITNDTYNILTQGSLKYMLSTEGEYKSEDVRVLADAKTIEKTDLFKIIMFWHLSSYFDMHPSNIIFVPDFTNKTLKPMVIDCEYTWGKETLSPQNPEIYQLHQAKTFISCGEMADILPVPQNKLLNIFKAYGPSLAKEKDLFLTRLNTLRNYCTENRTIGKLMNLILKPDPVERCITTYSGTLDKLEFSEIKLYTSTKQKLDLSDLYQVPFSIVGRNFLPELDWVFSIFDEKCLEGSIRIDSVENHKNLKRKEPVRRLLGEKHFI